MSMEGLAEKIGELADRRRFLRKVGAASLGALGFSVFAESAKALYQFGCCTLCNAPSDTCQGSVACSWCWNCCSNPRLLLRCCEGYAAGVACNGSCPAAQCSYWINLGCCTC